MGRDAKIDGCPSAEPGPVMTCGRHPPASPTAGPLATCFGCRKRPSTQEVVPWELAKPAEAIRRASRARPNGSHRFASVDLIGFDGMPLDHCPRALQDRGPDEPLTNADSRAEDIRASTQARLSARRFQTLGATRSLRQLCGVTCIRSGPAASTPDLKDAESEDAARTRGGNAPSGAPRG
jgi:hypothetical protein